MKITYAVALVFGILGASSAFAKNACTSAVTIYNNNPGTHCDSGHSVYGGGTYYNCTGPSGGFTLLDANDGTGCHGISD